MNIQGKINGKDCWLIDWKLSTDGNIHNVGLFIYADGKTISAPIRLFVADTSKL